MWQRIWLSLRRDWQITWRNFYYLVTLGVALVYLALTLWIIPSDTTLKPTLYVVDQTGDPRYVAYLQEQARAKGTTNQVQLLDGVSELQATLTDRQNSIGLLVRAGTPLPEITLFFQGYENPQVRNLLVVAIEDSLREVYDQPWATPVEIERRFLRPQAAAPIPFNHLLVPALLFSDATMIGLIFIAALIFMEKEEGTLLAYLVTPGRVWEYLLSKALNLGLLALLFALILVPLTVGGRANYMHLLALMLLGSMLVSLLGAWIAVHFENLTQFLFPAIVVITMISLPGIAYFLPGFAPLWLRLLPTYLLATGLREAVFPSGNPQIVYHALLWLLLLNGLLLGLSSRGFRRQMARAM